MKRLIERLVVAANLADEAGATNCADALDCILLRMAAELQYSGEKRHYAPKVLIDKVAHKITWMGAQECGLRDMLDKAAKKLKDAIKQLEDYNTFIEKSTLPKSRVLVTDILNGVYTGGTAEFKAEELHRSINRVIGDLGILDKDGKMVDSPPSVKFLFDDGAATEYRGKRQELISSMDRVPHADLSQALSSLEFKYRKKIRDGLVATVSDDQANKYTASDYDFWIDRTQKKHAEVASLFVPSLQEIESQILYLGTGISTEIKVDDVTDRKGYDSIGTIYLGIYELNDAFASATKVEGGTEIIFDFKHMTEVVGRAREAIGDYDYKPDYVDRFLEKMRKDSDLLVTINHELKHAYQNAYKQLSKEQFAKKQKEQISAPGDKKTRPSGSSNPLVSRKLRYDNVSPLGMTTYAPTAELKNSKYISDFIGYGDGRYISDLIGSVSIEAYTRVRKLDGLIGSLRGKLKKNPGDADLESQLEAAIEKSEAAKRDLREVVGSASTEAYARKKKLDGLVGSLRGRLKKNPGDASLEAQLDEAIEKSEEAKLGLRETDGIVGQIRGIIGLKIDYEISNDDSAKELYESQIPKVKKLLERLRELGLVSHIQPHDPLGIESNKNEFEQNKVQYIYQDVEFQTLLGDEITNFKQHVKTLIPLDMLNSAILHFCGAPSEDKLESYIDMLLEITRNIPNINETSGPLSASDTSKVRACLVALSKFRAPEIRVAVEDGFNRLRAAENTELGESERKALVDENWAENLENAVMQYLDALGGIRVPASPILKKLYEDAKKYNDKVAYNRWRRAVSEIYAAVVEHMNSKYGK